MKVITRARTMSGRRGGCEIELDKKTAKEWIADGWADPVEDPKKAKQARPASRVEATA